MMANRSFTRCYMLMLLYVCQNPYWTDVGTTVLACGMKASWEMSGHWKEYKADGLGKLLEWGIWSIL